VGCYDREAAGWAGGSGGKFWRQWATASRAGGKCGGSMGEVGLNWFGIQDLDID